ncbi:MAG: ornithine cyclodeaminase family protein [Candidatus Dadabacteria bacterium]|nr:MAG: ornithine cyclodeaminase family protein [Candidatus Dadabacteria bacterium]
MALYLTEADVQHVIDMPQTIDAVEQITIAQSTGRAWLVPRERLRMPKGMLHTMSAAWPERGYFAHKAYASIAGSIRFRVLLYDYDTGAIRAWIEGNRLGQLRTGAATAVAARRLLPPDPSTWALFGTGLQAEGQLEAMLAIGRPQQLRVFGRNADRRNDFAVLAAEQWEIDVVPAETPEACIDGANVVITATTSRNPVFDGSRLQTGSFVAAVGANMLIRRELDGKALRAIDRIIVDDIDTAKKESGMLLTPIEAGFMRWQDVATLPDLLAGRTPARRDDRETLCFHSLGSATWDLAAAIVAYENALEAGLGLELPID